MLQKNRAAMLPDAHTYDYLKDKVREGGWEGLMAGSGLGAEQVAEMLVDRVADVARYFPDALDVGCGRGHVAKAISGDIVGSLCQCDMAEYALVSIFHAHTSVGSLYGCCSRSILGLPPVMSSPTLYWLMRKKGYRLLARPLTLLSVA